jgi:hypothetical protein
VPGAADALVEVDLGAELEELGPHPAAETSPTSTIPIISTRVRVLSPALATIGKPSRNLRHLRNDTT